MTPLEREIARQRRELLGIDNGSARDLRRRYQRVFKLMRRELKALTKRIAEAREAGEAVSPSWLRREERYRSLVAQMDEQLTSFLRESATIARNGKNGAAAAAQAAAPRLTVASLGPGPGSAQAQVRAMFDQLPAAALDAIVSKARDGTPLARLFAEIHPGSVEAVRTALEFGVATGRPVRLIARDVRTATGMPLVRALSIARTEVIDAHRMASLETYRAGPAVRRWRWTATLDNRTCPVCWAMDGTEFPLTATLDSHPNDRCTMTPVTPSWAELGFTGIRDGRQKLPTGPEQFKRLSKGDQLAVLGRARLDAYNRGEISLDDLVRETDSARWGRGRRQATLAELGV